MTTETELKAVPSMELESLLVSFENSNSRLKVFDASGGRSISAGYRLNPGILERRSRNAENPVVIVKGQPIRFYGDRACQGTYTPVNGLSKIDTARDSFTAMLVPEYHEQKLTVIASHWDIENLSALQPALMGRYEANINGHEIRCEVVKVVPLEEGVGSYHAVRDELKPGATLLIEMGFGTCETWLIDRHGVLIDGQIFDTLGVSSLCRELGQDSQVRFLGQDNASNVSPALLSQYLESGNPDRINEKTWNLLKESYGREHLKRLQAAIKTRWGSHLQNIPNIVFTGGGAALLSGIEPKLCDLFVIPENPGCASVKGAYYWYLQEGEF